MKALAAARDAGAWLVGVLRGSCIYVILCPNTEVMERLSKQIESMLPASPRGNDSTQYSVKVAGLAKLSAGPVCSDATGDLKIALPDEFKGAASVCVLWPSDSISFGLADVISEAGVRSLAESVAATPSSQQQPLPWPPQPQSLPPQPQAQPQPVRNRRRTALVVFASTATLTAAAFALRASSTL